MPARFCLAQAVASLDQTNTLAIDFVHITNQLNETRQALAILEDTKKKAAARLEVAPGLRARLNDPSSWSIFKMNEVSRSTIWIGSQKSGRSPWIRRFYAGFPEHTVDIREPALLWASLALSGDLLATAVRCKVSAIHSLEVNLDLTNAPSSEGPRRWAQIPFSASSPLPVITRSKVIQSLPLRAEEIKPPAYRSPA